MRIGIIEKRLEEMERKLNPPLPLLVLDNWTDLELELAKDAGLIQEGRRIINMVTVTGKDADGNYLKLREPSECRPLDELKKDLEGGFNAKK